MKFRVNIKELSFFVTFFIVLMSVVPVKAEAHFSKPPEADLFLTEEEREYINSKATLKAVSVDGVAPLQYYDSHGQVQGIAKEVLDTISDLTGLKFTYKLYNTVDETMNSGADIIFGVFSNSNINNYSLSIPYLRSELIIFINSSVDPSELDNKKYAAVKGTGLPEGIKEENVLCFDTREACIDAVDSGKADFGYGNAYSVSFYMAQKNYKNIIIIPEGKEARAYCIALPENDEMLISIINKAISFINERHLNVLILNAATKVEKKITIPMIFDAYGAQINGAVVIIIVILSVSIIRTIKAKNEIKIQYERYQMLARTSNEYLYEYHVKAKQLELSKRSRELFGDINNLNELKTAFEKALINHENTIPVIELPVADGEKRFFKSVNSFLFNEKGRAYSIIGKLVDINEEEEEKKKLIKKSETDGLTGLYNAITTRRLIGDRLTSADIQDRDALIVIDCDKYKFINDSFGHLQGDNILINISNGLNKIFRQTDIIGRIGGDEFCVYMKDIASLDFVISSCRQLKELIEEENKDFSVTLSMGIAISKDESSYDELFRRADIALYEAKKKGGNQVQIDVKG